MLLEARALTKRFDGLVAVSDVSIEIARGEIVGIFGPNGSGKTTLMNLLSGIHKPTSGQILWKEKDISGQAVHSIASAGLVKTFQNPLLFAELTVAEHAFIASHLALRQQYGVRRLLTLFSRVGVEETLTQRVKRALELCRLDQVRDKTAATLSYGEEKMLGLAMALMCDPELLLLDEPASGLGREEMENLGSVLNNLRQIGTTLCIIDHKVDFLCRFSDRAIALQHGSKISEGTPGQVLADPAVVSAYLGRQNA